MAFEVSGIPFVAEKTWLSVVSGLRLDVESYRGREGIVATHDQWGSGC